MRVVMRVFLPMLLSVAAGAIVRAQSPNTATLIVVVSDQTGALVPEVDVSVVNTTTGLERVSESAGNGTTTFVALPLTGVYRVSFKKSGFAEGVIENIVLRAGETAQLKVKLVASGGASQVSVYGTASGVLNTS